MGSFNSSWAMSHKVIFKIKPDVKQYLNIWKQRAILIPDVELRKQALDSLKDKAFHCEGGAVYALLDESHYEEILKFIVAYQTISDYLDNLCDRSTSLDPEDFSALHESMIHALTPGAAGTNYYRFRIEQNDGGYLLALVKTCQDILGKIPTYSDIFPIFRELSDHYCYLQINKHVKSEERVKRLQDWFDRQKNNFPELRWYEFAASTGSTLGIFCLTAEAFKQTLSYDMAFQIKTAFFPWVQGLHILLDYLVDSEEDRLGGDLNFCSYYNNEEDLFQRLIYFYRQANASTSKLPDAWFHHIINQGLIGIYLGDRKVAKQEDVRRIARKIIRKSGILALLPIIYCWTLRHLNSE